MRVVTKGEGEGEGDDGDDDDINDLIASSGLCYIVHTFERHLASA